MRKIFVLIILTFLYAIPTKSDFNELFINVAQSGSHCVVSIVSEKVQKNNNMFFFGPFDFEDPYQQERNYQSC